METNQILHKKSAKAKLVTVKRKKLSKKKKKLQNEKKAFQYSFVNVLAKTEHLPRKTIENRVKSEEQQVTNGLKARSITEKRKTTQYFEL